MADSGLSASELRQRYHRGGSVPDDQLSSAQLRARHGISGNSKEFSSSSGSSSSTLPIIAGVVVVVIIVGALAYKFLA